MADASHHAPEKAPGYETRDIHVRLLVIWGAILAAVVIFSFLFMRWLFVHDVKAINKERPAPSALGDYNPVPPTPQLRVDALKDVAQLRAYEEPLLNTHSWISKESALAQIPVARAMELVAQHGLPSWAAPAMPAADTNAPAATTNAPSTP
jgi:hypothetical protein